MYYRKRGGNKDWSSVRSGCGGGTVMGLKASFGMGAPPNPAVLGPSKIGASGGSCCR